MVEPKYYNTAGHPRIGSTTSAPENNLSPAAQAVSNASKSSLDWESGYLPNAVAAAALRSAANDWLIDTEDIDGVEYIRTTTLEKIASELEAHQ